MPWTQLTQTSATSFLDDNLTPGEARTYRIVAVVNGVESDPSDSVIAAALAPDASPPETTILTGPDNGSTIQSDFATFTFTSSEPGASFQVRMDGGNWISIGLLTTYTVAGLMQGAHTFEVRSVDVYGNVEVFPATRNFVVSTAIVVVDADPIDIPGRIKSQHSRWRFVLVDSVDMSRIGILDDASSNNIKMMLNKSGSSQHTYPMDAEHANSIVPYRTAVLAERYNWRETLARHVAGEVGEVWDPIWSGYVLPIDEDWEAGTLSISCVGWMQRLEKRMARKLMKFNSMDDGAIIGDLLRVVANGGPPTPAEEWPVGVNQYTAVDGYQVRWPSGSIPNVASWMKWGGVQPNEGVGGSTQYVPQARTFQVEHGSFLLPAIEQLIDLENGCDVHVNPLSRILTCHRKYRRVRSDVIVAFNWGPNNMAKFTRNNDADRIVNYIEAAGEPGTTTQYAHSETSMDLIGPIEEYHMLSGVQSNEVLRAFAGAEILVRSQGVITYGVTPFVYSPDTTVPEPFVDYRAGDQIYVTAKHESRGHIHNQAVRVFGFNVSFSDGGTEQVGTLELSP